MMILSSIAAAILIQATGPAGPMALPVVLPPVEGTQPDPSCGGRQAMTTFATCLSTTQAAAEGAMQALNADFERQGWLPADGRDNRIVYVRRKDGGGCDAFQVLAFAAQQIPDPAGSAYLAFAVVPGDVCAAPVAPVAAAQ